MTALTSRSSGAFPRAATIPQDPSGLACVAWGQTPRRAGGGLALRSASEEIDDFLRQRLKQIRLCSKLRVRYVTRMSATGHSRRFSSHPDHVRLSSETHHEGRRRRAAAPIHLHPRTVSQMTDGAAEAMSAVIG